MLEIDLVAISDLVNVFDLKPPLDSESDIVLFF